METKEHAPCADAAFGAATIVLLASTLFFLGAAVRDRLIAGKTGRDPDPRLGLTFLISFVAFLSYFVMWFGHGHATLSRASSLETTRNVDNYNYMTAWARYADWLVTTPLLLLDLLWVVGFRSSGSLTSSTSSTSSRRGSSTQIYDIAAVITLDVIMIATGWIAAFTMRDWPRYILWGVSTAAMLGVFAYLASYYKGNNVDDDRSVEQVRYDKSLPWIFALWTAYPIVWLLSKDGLNLIDTCVEVGAYATLDVLAKAAFGAYLLYFSV